MSDVDEQFVNVVLMMLRDCNSPRSTYTAVAVCPLVIDVNCDEVIESDASFSTVIAARESVTVCSAEDVRKTTFVRVSVPVSAVITGLYISELSGDSTTNSIFVILTVSCESAVRRKRGRSGFSFSVLRLDECFVASVAEDEPLTEPKYFLVIVESLPLSILYELIEYNLIHLCFMTSIRGVE